MKRILIGLLASAISMISAWAVEDNNPCTHEWGDTQYECDTWISVKDGADTSLPCSSATVSAVESAAKGATQTGGVCQPYQICSKCGERRDSDPRYLDSKSASYDGEPQYDTEANSKILRTGGHSVKVSDSCHTTRECYVSIYIDSHNHELATDEDDRDVKECYMTGRVPKSSPNQYDVALQSLSVPLGSSHTFNVNWNNPVEGGVTNGVEYFNRYECTKCSVTWDFKKDSRPSINHSVEHPTPTGGGVYEPNAWRSHTFSFPQLGEGLGITFLKKCNPHKADVWNWNPKQISVFNCEEGKFEYTVDSVGVASLDYEPKLPKVYFKAIQEGERTKKTLYVLSEIKEEDVKEDGNKARGATEITFTAAATGSKGFPSVHPILGGFSDSELSDSQKETKKNYKYPIWSAWHDYCIYDKCIPDHHTFTGERGSTTAQFTGKTVGAYTLEVNCGTEQNPADPYDNFGTRTRFIKVCDPVIRPILIQASGEEAKGDEEPKKYTKMEPCNPKWLTFQLTVVQSNLPDGFPVELKVDEPKKKSIYEMYISDDNGKMVLFDSPEVQELLKVKNGGWSRKVAILPLEPEEEGMIETKFRITANYGIPDTELKADERKDEFSVIWNNCGGSGGMCSAGSGGAGIGQGSGGGSGSSGPAMRSRGVAPVEGNKSFAYASFSLGRPASGRVPGNYGFRAEELDYRVLTDNFTLFPGGEALTGRDEAGRVVWIKNGTNATTLSYTTAAYNEEEYVTGITVKNYESTDMTPGTAPTGGALVGETVFAMTLGTPGAEGEPTVNAINVTNQVTVNGSTQTSNWSFVRPESVFDLPEGYSWWQMAQDGVLTAVGTKYEGSQRRQLTVVGSAAEGIVRQTEKVEQLFPWGYSVVSEGYGDKQTRYTYYDGDVCLLKSETDPQGVVRSYEYNDQGEVTKLTEKQGDLTSETVTTYPASDNSNRQISISETRVNGVLTSKSRSETNRMPSTDYPDISIRYDQEDTEYTTTTYYTSFTGLDGTARTVPSVVLNSDGTGTKYEYSTDGDTETTVTSTGVLDNSRNLTLGSRTVSVVNRLGTQLSNTTYFIDTANNVNVKTAETINTAFDAQGRATQTTYLDGSTSSRTYGCCGVESETDQNGVTTTYAYDALQRLSHTIRDGITTLYSYDAAGNQTAVTTKGRDGGEITISSTYSNGELASTTDALGNVTTYTRNYATAGDNTTYTETVTNPDGSTQITTYLNGQQTAISGTAVHPQTFEYGPNWQKTLPQNQTVYTDQLGRQYKTVYADGTEALQYYNNKNQVIKNVSPAGRVTLYEYDGLGRQTKQAVDMNGNGEIDAADLVTSTAYSYGTESGKTVSIATVTQSQGENSKVTAIEKQSLDGLEQWSTDAAGLTTHIKQERLGNGATRQTQTNPDGTGVVSNMQNGTVTSVQQMNSDGTTGNVTTYTYDEYNRNTGTVEKAGETAVNTVAMTYDVAGQVLSQTVNGQTTTYAYDVVNRTRTTTLPGNRVIVEESWPTGELKRLSGADTYTQEWTWDPVWGTQATLTTWKEDAIPQVTTWVYNNRGFNTAKLYADNNGPTYTYDADGNMLTRTWARGIITTYTYDAAGRMTEQSYSDDTPSITASYNFLNQPLTITDAAGVRTLTYNSQSLLENETIPGIMDNMGSSYSYDAYGRRILRRLNTNGAAQAVSGIAYDVKGRVTSVGNGTDTLHYAYRPGLSQLDTATWRNSQDAVLNSRTYAYDAYHRLTGINLNNASEVAYTLNDKDQRTTASYAIGGTWSYSYDDKSQVTGATSSNTVFSYAYDGIGNRLTAAEGSDTWSYTSNLLNQYTAINSDQPTYDADGNMLTSGDGWLYTWNGENRLIRAENSDTLVEMAYDYMGRRIEKKVSSKGLFTFYNWNVDKHYKFAYDDYKLIAVYDAANNNALLMTFTWQPESVGLDVPVSMTYDGNTYYYVTDGNKNVTGLLDQAGNRVAEYVYGPFGQLLSAEGELAEVNPFRFSSEYADDETGLVYYNYRYYNAKLGRWIKRDSIEEEGGINLYTIVGNNIISQIDYLGKSCSDSTIDILRGYAISALGGSYTYNLLTTPLGPGFFVIDFTAGGEAFGCCNKGKKVIGFRGSIIFDFYYMVGKSFKAKTPASTYDGKDVIRGSKTSPGKRGRNDRLPSPDGNGYTKRKKHPGFPQQPISGFRDRFAYLFAGKIPPCDPESWDFFGEFFLRGSAGFGVGVQFNITKQIDETIFELNNGWDISGGVAFHVFGASIEAGGSGGVKLWVHVGEY